MGSRNIELAFRLGDILAKLNRGERLEVKQLAEEFNVSTRTIRRDLKDRLIFLDWEEEGPKYYSLSKSALGRLYKEDIERFAHFASIQNLFPKIDREFFQKQLTQSICVKGLSYEDISDKKELFAAIKSAIDTQTLIRFSYVKNDRKTMKNYVVEPYILINRFGIWYLIASDAGHIKTFCFSQMNQIEALAETFERDEALLDEIKHTDSIYYGSQLEEVIIEVNAEVAIYFIRRSILPNQSILETKPNGNLLVKSKHVSEQEILSLMRYWIPHVTINSPCGLQEKLNESLERYLQRVK